MEKSVSQTEKLVKTYFYIFPDIFRFLSDLKATTAINHGIQFILQNAVGLLRM